MTITGKTLPTITFRLIDLRDKLISAKTECDIRAVVAGLEDQIHYCMGFAQSGQTLSAVNNAMMMGSSADATKPVSSE